MRNLENYTFKLKGANLQSVSGTGPLSSGSLFAGGGSAAPRGERATALCSQRADETLQTLLDAMGLKN